MTGIYLSIAFLIGMLLFFNRNTIINNSLLCIFILVQWGYTIFAYTHQNGVEIVYFTTDALGLLLLVTLGIICVPAIYHSHRYLVSYKDKPRERAIYYSALVILLTAISAAYLSNHIAVTWVFVELTTLSASALIYHRRNIRTLEGTWKYVFICALSITLVFIGILFFSIAMKEIGSTELTFEALTNNASALNPFWLKLAFLFIFTGFTAKLGLVPMYTAGIDAKDKAPSPAGALFSSVLMNVGFVGIFRTYVVISHTAYHEWANDILMIASVLSVFVATIYITKVKNIKRLFAYSGVEHMGLVMMGIAAGGIGYYAAILHVILHALVKSALFFQVGPIYRIYQSKSIYDIGNYFRYYLSGAVALFIGYICTTAIPPSGMFVSEFMIFRALFESHHLVVLAIVFMLLTMVIWALGKNIFKVIFTPLAGFRDEQAEVVSPVESIFPFTLLALSVYLGINPPEAFVALIKQVTQLLP